MSFVEITLQVLGVTVGAWCGGRGACHGYKSKGGEKMGVDGKDEFR